MPLLRLLLDRLGDLTRTAIALMFSAAMVYSVMHGWMTSEGFMGVAGLAVGYYFGSRTASKPDIVPPATPPAP